MKILHVIQSLDPRDGGPPEVVACLAAAQARLGHDVTIASVPTPDDHRLTDDVPGFERVRRVAVRAPAGPARGLLDRRLADELAPVVAGFDVAHLHNVWDSLLPFAARAASRADVPYVVMPHGMLDPWSMRQHALRKWIAMRTTHRAMLRDAAAFHVLSEEGVANIRRMGLEPPAHFIPNGICLDRVDAPRPPGRFRDRVPAVGDDPIVLFISRLHFKKGLDYLLDAFDRVVRRHPRARLVIAGPDDGSLGFVRARAAAAIAPDRVHVVGPIYGAAKFAAFDDAACFVLPSRQEGFPIAALEAMAGRVPAVLSDRCHLDEIADAGAGYVVPLDADKLAGAIGDVLDTPNPRATFGTAGRRLVERKYTWPIAAERTLDLYAGLTMPRR